MKFSLNVLFTGILYCDTGPGCLELNCLQKQHGASSHRYHF